METPKPRRTRTKHVLQKNADVGRTLHIATLVVDKRKHEIMPKDYRVRSINVVHSSWGQELVEMKMNLETTVANV